MAQEEYDIGIFDSGIGGMSIAHSLSVLRPDLSILYIADNAHVPYGMKSEEQIVDFSHSLVSYCQKKHCRRVFIACNTAAIYFDRQERDKYPGLPIADVLRPLLEEVEELEEERGFSLLLTRASKNSSYFQKRFTALSKEAEFIVPETLVDLIESGEFAKNPEESLENELGDRLSTESSTIVLACTHFPLIANSLRRYLENHLQKRDFRILNAIENSLRHLSRAMPIGEEGHGRLDILSSAEDVKSYGKITAGYFPALANKLFEHIAGKGRYKNSIPQ